MPKDFLSSQIRTNQLIASRSLSGEPSFLVISSSNADGSGGVSPPLGAGSDAFVFISGSKGSDAFVVLGGSAKISGSLTVFDNITLGDSVADTISLVGRVNTSIVPLTTNIFSLGIPARKWLEVTSQTGSFDYLYSSDRAVFNNQISGSIQRTAAGLSYLVEGANITITSASNGQITISSTGAGGGGDTFFSSTTAGSIFTTGSAAFKSLEGIDSPTDKGSDVFFYVSGSVGSKGSATSGTALFGGDFVVSGSSYIGTTGTDIISIKACLGSDIIPDTNVFRNLGSPVRRFANIYTGDLHLKNDRGDYTIIEEEDCLTIRFNKTGKRYKFVLEPAPEFD